MTEAAGAGATHVSAADLGTNTVKITHASVGAGGSLIELRDAADTIRLGAGIEGTGRIEAHRIYACLALLESEEKIGRAIGSSTFIGVATEALRVASNGEELLERIRTETAWKIRVISGDEEARLTYIGLRDRIPSKGDSMVVDIGGGSTEVILVQHGLLTSQKSIPLGSGRLADRFFRQDPPGLNSVMDAANAAGEQLDQVAELPVILDTALFAGGNGVFISQLIHQLFPDDSLSADTLERLLHHLATAPAQDTADRLGIAHERARVLPAGASIAFAFLLRTATHEVLGVPSGVRQGLIREHVIGRD